jgi:MFS family permease
VSAVGERLSESVAAFRDVFRNRSLRRINIALAGSVLGDWAYTVAVSIWAFHEGGAAAVGGFGVARFVSLATFGPVLAAAADRWPRRTVMIVTDVVRAVMAAAGALAVAVDAPALVVYALALGLALAGSAFRPAQAALLPALADDAHELAGANVVATTIESVGFFVGPAVGALLLAVADVAVVFAFNGVTFLWSAAILLGLPSPPAAAIDDGAPAAGRADNERARFSAVVTAGFRVIGRNRELRLITALCAAQTVVAGASMVFRVTLALEYLDLGDPGVGLLDSVLAAGCLVGSLLAVSAARRGRLAVQFGVGVVLWSLPLLLIAASPTPAPVLIAMFVMGAGNSLVDINMFTIVQRVAPADVMGRVFGALESAYIVGMAAGALVMPVLIETVGLRAGLVGLGVAVTAAACAGLPRLARIDTTVLAPSGLALLRDVPFLAPLPAPVLERLAHSLRAVSVAPGAAVFAEGDPGDCFWIIETGDADVSVSGAPVRRLGPGDCFGEIALLRGVPRTASVRAGSGPLVLRGLDRDDFIPAVTGHGEASQVADAVVERLLAYA